MTVRSQVIPQSQTSPKTKQYKTTITKHTHTRKREREGGGIWRITRGWLLLCGLEAAGNYTGYGII